MRFYKIQPKEIPGNVISLFDDGWGLLTAGTPENYNTMTISWGQMGCLWNRPVCTVYVRPCRYTYTFTEACDRFTVSLFEPGEQRSELKMLGTQSGREMDKMHYSGLTPMMLDGLMAYALSDGSFRHTLAEPGSNQMATEQAFYALAAVRRAENGQSSLYRMTAPDAIMVSVKELMELVRAAMARAMTR